MMNFRSLFPLLLILSGCSDTGELDEQARRRANHKGEFVYRLHDESLLKIPPQEKQPLPHYPWEAELVGGYPRITKEFFRCKGSSFNPSRTVKEGKKSEYYADCGGPDKHSLPLRDGEEFIYPILITLTNLLQERFEKRIVITCGHRCPTHNDYVEPDNPHSKHTIGAEVSFYIEGMEEEPETIVQALQEYYTENPEYAGKSAYTTFERYTKSEMNISTLPWCNKEIFIKLFKEDEGRNLDNNHPHPYLSVQVRYDPDKRYRVFYSWEQAHRNYLRW